MAGVAAPLYWQVLERYVEKLSRVDGSVRSKGLDGEGCEGLYGSINFSSQLSLTRDLMDHGDLPDSLAGWTPDRRPVVVDFGAGTGRALVFWQALNMVSLAVGYELEQFKVDKAQVYMRRVLRRCRYGEGLPLRMDEPLVGVADLVQLPAEEVAKHQPTLGYSFWVGIPAPAKRAIGDIFMACSSMRTLVLIDSSRNRRKILEMLTGRAGGQGRGVVMDRAVTAMVAMGNKGRYMAFIIKKCDPAAVRHPAAGVVQQQSDDDL